MLLNKKLIEISIFFFFNDTATTEIYTLSLHDALPICSPGGIDTEMARAFEPGRNARLQRRRSEEHTSELQSQSNLVCRLLLEKKHRARLKAGPVLPLLQASHVLRLTELRD